MALAKALSISVLNQAASSGTNFLLGIYLVRILSPEQFGIYGIGFAACLLYAGLGNSLILTQMVVHYPDKESDQRASYSARMFILLFLFCTSTSLLIILLTVTTSYLYDSVGLQQSYIYAVLAASVANLIKEYFIRYAYVIRREYKALIVSVAWSICLVTLLIYLEASEIIQTSTSALWVYALSNMFAALTGLFISKLPIKSAISSELKKDFHESFIGGRWAMGGVLTTWLQSQAYVYITALLLGPVGVAMGNASRLLISPFTFIVPAVNQIVLPRLSGLRNDNMRKMLRMGYLITCLLTLAGLGYLLFLTVNLEIVVALIVGERYEVDVIKPLVFAWGVVLIIQLLRSGGSNLLQAIKLFKLLMLNNLISAVLAISATCVLAKVYGVLGAIFGVAIGELTLTVLLWMRIRNVRG